MDLKLITDKEYAQYIFTQGVFTNDRNSKNHTIQQFELAWKSWLGFFVMYKNEDPVLFSGIREFGIHARIFDRYMVFPEHRRNGLRANEYVQEIVNELINHVPTHTPFFSIERVNRRRTTINTTKSINKVLPKDKQFHVLEGMYETAPNSWQNISIQKPHSINLPRKIGRQTNAL